MDVWVYVYYSYVECIIVYGKVDFRIQFQLIEMGIATQIVYLHTNIK